MTWIYKTSAAIIAMLALCWSTATAAEAAASLDIGGSPAIITGAQVTQNKFIYGESGTSSTCTTATLQGTTVGTNVSEVTLTPFYGTPAEKTCKLGGLASSVEVGTCTYLLKGTATALTASFSVTNCGSGAITKKNTTCTITIANQGPLSTVTLKSEGAGETADVLATLNVTGITYVGSSGCPANIVGSHSDGKLTGTQTLKAFKDVSGVEGAQTSLKAT